MRRTYFKILLFCYFTDWKLVEGRQYDVNAEAVKLYGEDLNTILKRFRRTPEYLEILNAKVTEMNEHMNEMMLQVTYSYSATVLASSINDMFDTEDRKTRRSFRRPSSLIYGKSFFPRADDNSENDNSNETTINAIKMLDSHAPLHSMFTVSERNALKDLGFKVAGAAIHRMIDSMGPEEDNADKKSTRILSNDWKKRTTTEHAENHEVTPHDDHNKPAGSDSTTPADTARFLRANGSNSATHRFHVGIKGKASESTIFTKMG